MPLFSSRCILGYTCDDSVATVRAGNLAMPPPLRGRVSQRFHEYSAVFQLLGLAGHAAGDVADHGRQRQAGGQRNRAVSPCTPLARSPSVDHEADILPSERAMVIMRARAISSHWDSGTEGRAPWPIVTPLGPPDSAAFAERARRSAGAAPARASRLEAEHRDDGMVSCAVCIGQSSASAMHAMALAAREKPMQSSAGEDGHPHSFAVSAASTSTTEGPAFLLGVLGDHAAHATLSVQADPQCQDVVSPIGLSPLHERRRRQRRA